MSEQPRERDRVRVTYEADYVRETDGHHTVDVADGMGPIHVTVPAWASVEVLERADDPAKDDTGTVREGTKGVWVKAGDNTWVLVGGSGSATRDDSMMTTGLSAGSVIGGCPGTPAAEAEKPRQPVPLSEIFPEVSGAGVPYPPDLWTGDGSEEPPEHVTTVEDVQGDLLRRDGDKWVGASTASRGEGYPLFPKPWENHVLPKYAPYTEVRS